MSTLFIFLLSLLVLIFYLLPFYPATRSKSVILFVSVAKINITKNTIMDIVKFTKMD